MPANKCQHVKNIVEKGREGLLKIEQALCTAFSK
jgi:hypothetical protein